MRTTPQQTARPLLDVRGLSVEYAAHGSVVRAVDDVSFSLARGEALALVGESGSGKTALALGVARLLQRPAGRIAGGEVIFDGRDLLELSERDLRGVLGRKIGFVFQDPMSSLNPALTVGYQIAEPMRAHLGLSAKAADHRVIDLLAQVGIPEARRRAREYPHQFSGGMRQRVMIAIALSCVPDLIIADEPTTALDVSTQAQILELMEKLIEESSAALLLITHDIAAGATLCRRIAVMYAGRIVELGPTDVVLAKPEMPYTMALLEALPTLDSELGRPVRTIEGRPPDLGDLRKRCRFSERCGLVRPICTTREPGLEQRGFDAHLARCFATEPGGWAQRS
jgi:oligopeptide/dipeptide ABC transporter ATP-binding protein